MGAVINMDHATYERTVRECKATHIRGNATQAKTLAMSAGVDAGLLGIEPTDCPFIKPGFLELELHWGDGRKYGAETRENQKRMRLL